MTREEAIQLIKEGKFDELKEQDLLRSEEFISEVIELFGESEELSKLSYIIPEKSIKSKELALRMIKNGCIIKALLDEKLNEDSEIIVEHVLKFRR